MSLFVGTVPDEMRNELERLWRKRTGGAAAARRAAIILRSAQGQKVPAIALGLGLCQATVRKWIRRFAEEGLAGLAERSRPGRPVVYSEVKRGEVIQLALTSPQKLSKPFCHWTLDLLTRELHATGCSMNRAHIHRVLRSEGVKWQKQRTWLTSPDPEFAVKRGRSLASTSIPLRAAT